MPTTNVCDAALEKIGRARPFYFYSMLRRVSARRQLEIANLMEACADYSFSFLNLLIFASKPRDFVREKRRMRGLREAELARIERIIPPLEAAFWDAARTYASDARTLMVTEAYVRRLLGNPQVATFLNARHPEVFRELNRMGLECGKRRRGG